MPAYVVAFTELTDPTPMAEYAEAAGRTIASYGGRLIAGGPVQELLESGIRPDSAAVIEFKSVDAARAWYGSEEYGAVRPLREGAGRSTLVILEGFQP